MKTEQEILSVEGSQQKLCIANQTLRGNTFRFFVICKNEEGEQISLPFDPTKDFVVNLSSKVGKIDTVTQHTGQLNIWHSGTIDTISSSQTTRITCREVRNLVCNQAILSNVQTIHKCYAGCAGSHLKKEGTTRIRKSRRNPFDELPELTTKSKTKEMLKSILESNT